MNGWILVLPVDYEAQSEIFEVTEEAEKSWINPLVNSYDHAT